CGRGWLGSGLRTAVPHIAYRCAASSVYTDSRGRTAAGSGGPGGGPWACWAAAAVGSTGGRANGGATAPRAGASPIPPIKAMYCFPSRRYVIGGPLPATCPLATSRGVLPFSPGYAISLPFGVALNTKFSAGDRNPPPPSPPPA